MPPALVYQADCPGYYKDFIRDVINAISQWEKAENIKVLNIWQSDSGSYYVRFLKDTGGKYAAPSVRSHDRPPVYGLIGDILDLTVLQSVTLLSFDRPGNHEGKLCFKLRRFTDDHFVSVRSSIQ